jgi:hypothetical protein
MRRFAICLSLGLAIFAGALIAGCKAAPPPPPPAPEFRPTSPIADVMKFMVEPSADVLWNAVATTVNEKGIDDHRPTTDEEWDVVKRSGVALVEATNLLLIDRPVANPGTKSANPNVELEPEQIEKLRHDDPETWKKYVKALYDAAMPALNAINKKDADGLGNAGEGIDTACENCHLHYWYPPNKAPDVAPSPRKSE